MNNSHLPSGNIRERLCYNLGMLMLKVVPEQNMARFYEVHVQSTLLDNHAVVCTWGSIKSRYNRVRMIQAETKEEAEQLASRIILHKTRKGYLLVT